MLATSLDVIRVAVLSKPELGLVRRLIFGRIGQARGIVAGSLVWFMSRRMLEEYPESAIVAAVGRFRGEDTGHSDLGYGSEVPSRALGTPQVEVKMSVLRAYVESCLVAEHGVGATPSADFERAFNAAFELHLC